MQFHFVLVNPARGENVGFAARALKTLGFNSLRIVGDNLEDTTAARKTGYGAHDLLDRVTNYQTLSQALQDIDLSVGTTAKPRIKRYDAHSPQEIGKILSAKASALKNVGLVFGSEENGLSTQELDLCDLISTIPLATDYPSLNLAQSVLIYAWEMSRPKPGSIVSEINPQLQGQLKDGVRHLLDQLDFDQKPLLVQRIMDRVMLLDADDSALLMSVLANLARKL